MKRLTVENFGDKVQGVHLKGDRRNPEPESFRVVFPGGDVDVVRTSDDEYWVHVRVNRPEDCVVEEMDRVPGRLVDGRLDISDRHSSEVDAGDFDNPNLYHLAVRVAVEESKRKASTPTLFDEEPAR